MKRFSTILTGIVFITLLTAAFGGYRLNLSPSIAGRVWQITDRKPERGEYAIVCLPTRVVERHALARHVDASISNTCGGVLPILKRVTGAAGDRFVIDRTGIRINDQMLPGTGQILTPEGEIKTRGRLADHEYLVVGETGDSVDSRYFGSIDEKWIIGTAHRVF